MSKGMENDAADVIAACTGRAAVAAEIPSSSRAWTAKASFMVSLLGNLPRKDLIDTALYVDLGKLIQFKRGIVAQLFAFAREIRPFRVRLRTDGHILASSHRHGASNQPRDTRDQDGALRHFRCGYADDQAGGRNDAIVGPKHCGPQPPNSVDKVVFGVQAKAAHSFPFITPSSSTVPAGALPVTWR